MLYIADEAFFTGTAAEITPIRSVDKIVVGHGSRGPLTEALQKAFFDVVECRVPDELGWLTFVQEPAARVKAREVEVASRQDARKSRRSVMVSVIVKLDAEPLASYQGGIAGLAATSRKRPAPAVSTCARRRRALI
jgi:hypothetical protein